MTELKTENAVEIHPTLAFSLHRARRATENRQPLAHEHVSLLVARIDALEAGLRDVREFLVANPRDEVVQTKREGELHDAIAAGLETRASIRLHAKQAKADNCVCQTQPDDVLRLCDGLDAAHDVIAAQASDMRALVSGLPWASPRMNAELMRAVLEEIAAFRPKVGDGEGVREWNRAGRYAAVAAAHALRVASYSPVYDDETVTETLSSYPDSARVVVRDHDGYEADSGLNVGRLTMILSRCEAFEQLKHGERPPAPIQPLIERYAAEIVAALDRLPELPEEIRKTVAELDAALVAEDEKRRIPE